jgi:uncharacterized protein (TIGR03437 family)
MKESRRAMKKLFPGFWMVLISAAAAELPAPEQARLPPCRGSGFVVLQYAANRDMLPKPDARLDVHLDGLVFRNNSFEESLRRALEAWSTVSGSNWRYNVQGYTDSAYETDGRMSIVRGGHGWQFPRGVLAAAFVATSLTTGQIIDSDIFYNPGLPINTYADAQEYDFELIALHELGHALGLGHNDHCVPSPTVMESTVSPGTKERRLYPQEMDGVRYLYSGREAGVALAPLALTFLGVEGNPAPEARTIVVTGPAGTTWTAGVSAGPWLSISAGSGGVPAELTVRVATENLTSGLYRGNIVISSAGMTQTIPVELNLTAPILALRPRSLSFSAVPGGPAPEAQILGLVGTGGAAWTATVTTESGGDWLRLSVTSGRLPATVSVTVNPANLTPGSYTGTVRVTGAGETREMTVTLEVAAQSRLMLEPAEVSLAGQIGSQLAVCAPVRIGSFGNVPLEWRASTDASWLSLAPSSGRSPVQASVCAVAGSLPAGQHTGTVSVTAAVPNSPQAVTVRFSVTPAPALPAAGVVSAASFAANQPVSAGQMLSLFGSNLSGETAQAASFPLPTELAGTRVLLGGVAAPLLYVSPGQINLIAPSQIRGQVGSGTTLSVFNGRLATTPVRVSVARQSPGVFTALGTGAGAGAITHADGSLVSRANPVRPGDVISVYLTGIGPLEPEVPDGAAAPADPLARAAANVRLRLDAQEAEVLYAGAAPGFAGLHVVVARVPEGLTRRFPEVVVESEGVRSNRTSAGGPSLLDATPAVVRAGADAVVTLRGINLPAGAAVRVGNETLAGTVAEGPLQSVRVTIPGRVLARGEAALTVVDPAAPAEHPSNAVVVRVE